MDTTNYGQADYYYAVSKRILDDLLAKALITEEQRDKIDDLNRKTIFAKYPSIAELEVSA